MGHYSTDLKEGTVTKNTAVLDISGRQTWPKTLPRTMVLDIYRTPWSWTYRNDPVDNHREMIQGNTKVVRGKHEKGRLRQTWLKGQYAVVIITVSSEKILTQVL